MNNHRNITLDEIYNLMAEKMPRKVSDVSIEMYLTALYKVILEQLKIRGRISIRGFGTFYLDKREGQQKMMYNPKIKNKELYKKMVYHDTGRKRRSIFRPLFNSTRYTIYSKNFK